MLIPKISVDVHEWEDGARTVITRDARGCKVHICNYDAKGVTTNQTVCVYDDQLRVREYVKYFGNGIVDHFATYAYEGDRKHESALTVFDKNRRPMYKKLYVLKGNGRPERAEYYDPEGGLKSYEEYVYEGERCVSVRYFDPSGHEIEGPLTD